MTKVKCDMSDCINRGTRLCKEEEVDIKFYEGICKQYKTADMLMRQTQSLDNRAKLK